MIDVPSTPMAGHCVELPFLRPRGTLSIRPMLDRLVGDVFTGSLQVLLGVFVLASMARTAWMDLWIHPQEQRILRGVAQVVPYEGAKDRKSHRCGGE